jgi:Na+-driven multidrug efflux pump
LVCEVSAVFLIPMAFGPDSIWLAAPASELGAFLFAILLLLSNRKRYHY